MSIRKTVLSLIELFFSVFLLFAYNPSGHQQYVFPYNDDGRPFPYTVYKTERDANFESNAVHLDENEYEWMLFYLEDLERDSVYGKRIYKMYLENDEEYYIPENPLYILAARTYEDALEYLNNVNSNVRVYPSSDIRIVDGLFGSQKSWYLLSNGYAISNYELEGLRNVFSVWRIDKNIDALIEKFILGHLSANKEDNGDVSITVNYESDNSSSIPLQLVATLNPSRKFYLGGFCAYYTNNEPIGLKKVILKSEIGEFDLSTIGSINTLNIPGIKRTSESLSFYVRNDSSQLNYLIDYCLSDSPVVVFKGTKKTDVINLDKESALQNYLLIDYVMELIQTF